MHVNGQLILIEGLDRCGKDTQIEQLLQKIKAVRFNFPNEELESGKQLRRYLNKEIQLTDKEVNDLFAYNRRETLPAIQQHLDEGTNVLLSRYAFSGVAYTSAKGTMSIDDAIEPDKGILIPSLTILLYQDPKAISSRYSNKDRYETTEFQAKVLAQYFELMKKPGIGKWISIDCFQKSIEQISSEIWTHVQDIIAKNEKVLPGLFQEK